MCSPAGEGKGLAGWLAGGSRTGGGNGDGQALERDEGCLVHRDHIALPSLLRLHGHYAVRGPKCFLGTSNSAGRPRRVGSPGYSGDSISRQYKTAAEETHIQCWRGQPAVRTSTRPAQHLDSACLPLCDT